MTASSAARRGGHHVDEVPVRFASNQTLTAEELRSGAIRSYPRPSVLAEPVEGLDALSIATWGDLVEHLPHSHSNRQLQEIAQLAIGQQATVGVTVRAVSIKPMRNRRQKRVEARVFDQTGPLVAVWFNRPWVARELKEGTMLLLHGKLRQRNQFWVTEHELIGNGEAPVHTLGLVPVHPATQGVSPARLRQLVSEARSRMLAVVEPLPARLRIEEQLPERPAAIEAVHFPISEEDERDARRRLAFEELFLLQLAMAGRRRTRREGRRARPLEARGVVVDRWRWSLPFELTGDQQQAIEAIDADLGREQPMQRLLMGEVGSGKTVVALAAMLRAVENGAQAALMAPTETLAEQHHRTLDSLLGGPLPVELLTGSTSAARRRELLDRLANGQLQLVVGTHALIEDSVEFRDLAMVVVDEQHRFGVRQRAALDAKAPGDLVPHALHMTATPIPRTLSLSAYGDLDATVLRELPLGRQPVETHVVDGARARARAYERIREEIAQGRQCFVVCPLVEESEALQAKAATAEFERLRTTEFADVRVELIHGQMPSKQKAAAMKKFAAGEADVLVATSVIEVGIDVPNATVMLIEAAERYGLSQLHQLRGRVGRGEHASVCIVFGDPTLPRLEAIARERDGFRLAEVDLELRGAGDVLGTRQHGLPEFRVARLPEDLELLVLARDRADQILIDDPRLEQPEHALLREAVVARFGSELDPIPA
ncbi:MAG TPA: ATP-dependent DNA helicase RecG [Thermoleophilaceae bacterium]|nr:ATP-dependent DNA helicase RecG [Thermoleophilaceae bacterium]